MALIKKNWQKDASKVATNAAIRAAGGLAACYAGNKWFSYKKKEDGTTTSETLQNLSGPGMVIAGVLGDLMFEDEKIRSFCQGVTVYGVARSLAVISPDGAATALGFEITNSKRGLGETDQNLFGVENGINALGTTQEAAEIAELSEGEETYNDTDGKTYNNDWAYLAENIEQADNITKTVSGVDEETAADLMGTDTEEEAALLMGMF